jgi:enediyne biosynthesis protein E4
VSGPGRSGVPRSSPCRAAVLVPLAFALAGCGKEKVKELPKTSGEFTKAPANTLKAEPPPKLRYVDVTREAGIDFVHANGAFGKKYLPETMGAGCAFFDYDGDGDNDLFFVNGALWPEHGKDQSDPTMRLYRNDGGWKFTDVTRDAGLAVAFYGMGCAVADVDGDADPDLFVSGVGGYLFFRNDGGRFTESSKDAGLVPGTWKDDTGAEHGPFATSAAFLDYDGDLRPDLFVCHYVHWSPQTDVFSTLNGKDKTYAIPTLYAGESCRLWRNLGDGRFEDATAAAGVRNDKGKSLGVAVLDLGDGRPSLIVANDTQPNYLYRNDGNGRFTDIGGKWGCANDRVGRARAGMGIDVRPPTSEQPLAVAIGNFSGEPVSFWERAANCFLPKEDVVGIALVTHPVLTFGLRFLDADLDGRSDLLLANGHIEPTIQETQKNVQYRQPTQLLRALQGGSFADVTSLVGEDLGKPRVARSIAAADVDGDGDLDLCITTNGGPPALLRCDLEDAAKRSLRIHVRGKAPATDALGAKVVVTAGGRTQTQWVRSGGGYLGQSEFTLTFGLADAGRADKVEILWPDGTAKSYENVSSGALEAQP